MPEYTVKNLHSDIQVNTLERRNEGLKAILYKIDGVRFINGTFDYELSIHYSKCFDKEELFQIINKEVGLYFFKKKNMEEKK